MVVIPVQLSFASQHPGLCGLSGLIWALLSSPSPARTGFGEVRARAQSGFRLGRVGPSPGPIPYLDTAVSRRTATSRRHAKQTLQRPLTPANFMTAWHNLV
jgi:hypothetical protein